MTHSFTDSVVVPIANEEDAHRTATSLKPYDIGDVTVLYVVEKGEGVPDKTPIEQSEQVADKAFDRFHEKLPYADVEVVYRRDIVDGILEVTENGEASAIVFQPRGGNPIVQFLAGDRTLRSVTEANCPVITLPNRRNVEPDQ